MKWVRGLKNKVFSGISWLALSKGINRAFVFFTTLILARLLSPEAFGLVASASVVLSLLNILNDAGLSITVAQVKDLEEDDLSSIFWPNLGLGVLLFLVAVHFSGLASSFFSDPGVKPVLILLSFSLVIDSLGLVQASYLTRLMDFRRLSVQEIFASFGFGASAIIAALMGLGVWSLVIGRLVQSFFGSIILWFSIPWRPAFSFNFETFKRIYIPGVKLVGNGFMEFLRENADRGLIGRFLGTSALGIYSVAYSLIMTPRNQMTALAAKVLLPAYSKIQGDDKRTENAYIKALKYVAFITVPASLGLAVVAPEFVEIVFGSKWMAAVVPLQFLSVAGALLSINPIVSSVLFARGKPGVVAVLNTVGTFFTTVLMYLGLKIAGLPGLAAAYSFYLILETPITQYVSARSVGGNIFKIWRGLFPVFLSSGLMCSLVFFVRHVLTGLELSKLVVLLSSVSSGFLFYLILTWAIRFEPVLELSSMGIKFIRKYANRKRS